MSKFNSKSTQKHVKADSVNVAGGNSYSRDDVRQEVAMVILNSMINGDKYYEKEQDRLVRLAQLVSVTDAEFIAKAMVYARNEGNLRSISHFLATVLAENVKGSTYLRAALNKAFRRPDDLTETLALWNARNKGKMVPNVLRRSFKDRLESFDSYQLKKYEGLGNLVKLRDVVKLAHPKGDFKALIEGTMENIQTAQTVNASSTGAERAGTYKTMLANRSLGIMAALKNIKNMLEAGADDETVDMLCALFRNENAVMNSRLLPFRFVQAYNIVDGMSIDRIKAKKILAAIEQAFTLSARNIEIVSEGEKIALLLDESGSMGGHNEKSPFSIGKALMASMLTGLDKSNTVGYLWADRCREVSIDDSPMSFIKNTRTQGGGTDVWAPISKLIETKTFVDKIVVFTDMQMYDIGRYGWGASKREFKDMVKEYRKINPNVKVLFWNLAGYAGGTPMKLDHNILEVGGFSDNLMSVVPKMWKDKNALIAEIEAIDLSKVA